MGYGMRGLTGELWMNGERGFDGKEAVCGANWRLVPSQAPDYYTHNTKLWTRRPNGDNKTAENRPYKIR